MFKKLLPAITISIAFTCCILASASPAEVAPDDNGNTTGLIEIMNPSTTSSSTTQDSVTISGVSVEGVLAGLYKQNGDENYKIMVIDGELAEQLIGPSGLYAQKVYLIQGSNELLIRAESADGSYEIKKFEINLLNDNFWERLKKIPFNLQQ